MPAYLVVNIEVTDQAAFARYREAVVPVVAQFGGRYLVRGGTLHRLEGDFGLERLVIIEFPSIEQAQQFYDSAEYAELLALRLASTRSDAVLVEGYVPPA